MLRRGHKHPVVSDVAKDERTRYVAVREIRPVISAETAVGVQVVKDVKGQKYDKN